jgi:hypothetical protein
VAYMAPLHHRTAAPPHRHSGKEDIEPGRCTRLIEVGEIGTRD